MYDIILNPKGGRGESLKALQVVKEALELADKKYTVHESEYAGHTIEIVKQLNTEKDDLKLIVLGGDGTFNEVLNGIVDFSKLIVGLVPCGSGNDFVKASNHPIKYKDAVDIILKDNVQYVDYIQAGDRRCLNVAGAGMDVDVLVKYANVKKLKGKAAYNWALIYTLLHTRFHHMELTVNGETYDKNVFMIGIGNGQCIGGGIKICPNGIVDDGKLDIVAINEMKKSKIFGRLPQLMKGKHVEKDYSDEYTADSCHIKILDDSQFQFDGEIQPEDVKEIDLKCVHGELKMYR